MLKISYQGTSFEGWQSQPSKNTIEDAINSVFYQLYKEKINIKGVSRTDRGVHAKEQWATVILKTNKNIFSLQRSLNALLAPSICITNIAPIKDTELVHSAEKIKTYKYQIFNASYFSIFCTEYYWFVPKLLDINKMQQAANSLIGIKDFQAFRNKGCAAKTTIRELLQIRWEVLEENNAKKIFIFFSGNGFLKQMVRNIVGTLVDVGLGKKEINIFDACFEKNANRSILGETAPAQALFLEKIILREQHS